MIQILIENQTDDALLARETALCHWATFALQAQCETASVLIRFVSPDVSAQLNTSFRGKSGPTNVLSFQDSIDDDALDGALVICSDVAWHEHLDLGIEIDAHLCHLIVHGCLHLCGFDHINNSDAETMEALEIEILNQLGYANPYGQTKGPHSE